MKKILVVILLAITMLGIKGLTVRAAPPQFPTNQFTSWTSVILYSTHHSIQSNTVIFTAANGLTIFIPNNLYTTYQIAGIDSYIAFYDSSMNLISNVKFKDFGGGDSLFGWQPVPQSLIPTGSARYKVVITTNYSAVPSGFITWFTDRAYAGGGDLLASMTLAQAYKDGYDQAQAEWDELYGQSYRNTGKAQAAFDIFNNGFGSYGYDDIGSNPYNKGLTDAGSDWEGDWLPKFMLILFAGPALLDVTIFPGMKLWYLVAVPLVLGLLGFILTVVFRK